MLLNSPLLRYVEEEATAKKYNWLNCNKDWDQYLLDCQLVFAPVKFGLLQKDLRSTLNWINKNIVLQLPQYIYYPNTKTLNVVLRIATGMINKLDLPDEIKQEMHMNMINNIEREIRFLDLENLPF